MDEQRAECAPLAVVTGASQGLGRAVAHALAERGWGLVVDAQRADRLARAASELASLTTVVALPGDVADPAHRDDLVRAAARLGPVRLLVNNASTLGASPLPGLDRIDATTLEQLFATNVTAPLLLVQGLLPAPAAGATVVNVTSDAGTEPYVGWCGYGASKAALEQASHVLALERPDLRVLVFNPGDMRTEMHQDAFPGEDISDRPLPEARIPGFLALLDSSLPSGRYDFGPPLTGPERRP